MNFALNQNAAIVWFAKSNLQLAFTISDSIKNDSSINTDNPDNILTITLDQFNPHNENQHFFFQPINPQACFLETFITIESISKKGFFLDIENEKLCLTKNPKQWQFYDGHFRCNDGTVFLSVDSNNNYSFRFVDLTKSLHNNISHESLFSQIQYNQESTFHLCFYNGNSIPKNVPIFFYSPLYKSVITLITETNLNGGGHWLRMLPYDPHKSSQIWFFGHENKDVIVNSELTNQVFDYYNDNSHYLLYTHYQHGRENQCWDYHNYKLITRQADRLIVEYDSVLQELKMRNDNTVSLEPDTNSKDINWDYFGKPNTFLIFMSNQRNLTNFFTDLDLLYLSKISIHAATPSILRLNDFRDENNECLNIGFKNDSSLNAYLSESPNGNQKQYPSPFLLLFSYVKSFTDDKLSITSDPRVMINDIQLDDNCKVVFSLLVTHDSIESFFNKQPHTPPNLIPNYRQHMIFLPGPRHFRNRNHFVNNNNNNDDYQPIREMLPPSVTPQSFQSFIPESKDQLQSEFQSLFDGGKIEVSTANSKICRLYGEKYQIFGLVDIANFVDSFSAQFSKLIELSAIQNELMEINSQNIRTLVSSFEQYLNTYGNDIIEWIFFSVYSCKILQRDNLRQFATLLAQQSKQFINPLTTTNDKPYYTKRTFYTIDNTHSINIESSSQIINYITKDNIEEFQKVFSTIKSPSVLRIEGLPIPFLQNRPTYIQYAAYTGSIQVFKYLFLQQICILDCDSFGRSLFLYALVGGNPEIVHIVHQYLVQKNLNLKITTDFLQIVIQSGNNSILQWILTNFKLEGLDYIVLLHEAIQTNNIEAFLSFIGHIRQTNSQIIRLAIMTDNTEITKLLGCFWFHNKESMICDAAVNGNVRMMKNILKTIPLDENLRKLCIKIAIKLDNLEMFNFLRNNNDISYENFLYSAFDESPLILSLLSEKIDFTNIYINGNSFLYYLLLSNKLSSLDALLSSKYLKYDKKEIGKLFKHAVITFANSIADKLYALHRSSCNINDKEILASSLTTPARLSYIIKFPELDFTALFKKSGSVISFLNAKNGEQWALPLLQRLDVLSGSFYEIIVFSIEHNYVNFYTKLIESVNDEIQTVFKNHFNELLEICLNTPNNQFALKLLIQKYPIDQKTLKELCFKHLSPILLETFWDRFSQEEVLDLFIKSLKEQPTTLNFFIDNFQNFGSVDINQIDVENGKNPMTYLISKNQLFVLGHQYTNTILDKNACDKNNFSPFMELLTVCATITTKSGLSDAYCLEKIGLNLHDHDLKYAIELNHQSGISYIISNLDLYIDDPIELIKSIAKLNNHKFIYLLGEYVTKDPSFTFFYPSILLPLFQKYQCESYINFIYQTDRGVPEPFLDLFAIYDCKMDFYSQNKSKIEFGNEIHNSTYFSNVRDLEIAIDLYHLMNTKPISSEIKIKEITGLNINGETCLYRSVVDNNLSLFSFLVEIATQNGFLDLLIMKRNKDSSTFLQAISENANWMLFINLILNKVDHFEIEIPNVINNIQLFELLFKNNKITPNSSILYSLLKLDLWETYEQTLYQNYPDFKLNMYMPIEHIKNQSTIEQLLKDKRIDFESTVDSDYLLISVIKSKNISLSLFLIQSDYPIRFDSQDKSQKTALHYAIENSLDQIVFILINKYCSNELFNCFFIEDHTNENPIHYIFKSFNIKYVNELYCHLKTFMNQNELSTLINSLRIKSIGESDKIGHTILTYSIVNANCSYVHSLLTTLKEIDGNIPNSINQTPLYLSFDNFDVFRILLNADNNLQINHDCVFKVFDIKSHYNYINCLKAIIQYESFDINLKNSQNNLCFGDYLAMNMRNHNEIWPIYLHHPNLKINWKPESISFIIKNDFHRFASYSHIFSRLTNEEIQTFHTDDEVKDTIATLAAKYGNYSAISGLIKDGRIDLRNQVNGAGKSFFDILKENDKFDEDFIDLIWLKIRK